MSQRTRLAALSSDLFGQEICLRGWLRTVRNSKKFSFLNLNDGSTQSGIQIIADAELPDYEEIAKLATGSAVEVIGQLVESPGKGQAFEVQAQQIRIYGRSSGEDYPLQKKGHTLEFLREIAHLRPRTNTFGAVFRIRNTLADAVHRFFQERGFLYIHTPIITASDTEGAGALFQVTTLPLDQRLPLTSQGKPDYSADFFDRPVFLTVSGQLNVEAFACSFGDVYTFGPTFRAENSNTSRHLAEFWMIEPEVAFCELSDLVQLATDFLKFLLNSCLERHSEDLAFLQKMYDPELCATLEHIVSSEFKTVSYTEAVEILQRPEQSFEFPVEWGADLQSEHERYLTEQHYGCPVVLTDYPLDIKAFYMKQNPDGRTVAAMDVLFPRIGEIIGGSQREENLEQLQKRLCELDLPAEEYGWYLDLRRYGSVPHSGFGLGFERIVQFVTGMKNIRDVIPFPRVPGHAKF
ncbi:MAG TPA: asparagine--tRNA ligase [Deltaproteobacteria bacterium]|nr:asparagine--tRNA ligase [Deltaproteobacteria bacterium]|tara:strand:+ start:3434 stop:4825 length:1392 start_codon:yes stop_codon:yes gene_type:complete